MSQLHQSRRFSVMEVFHELGIDSDGGAEHFFFMYKSYVKCFKC